MEANNTPTLTGYDAIEYAEANGLTLNKYADPTEDAREGLTVEEARAIAQKDASLIWVAIKAGWYSTAVDTVYVDAEGRIWIAVRFIL